MFELKIVAANAAELTTQVGELYTSLMATTAMVVDARAKEEAKPAAKKSTKTPTTTASTTKESATSSSEEVTTSTPETAANDEKLDYADIQKAVVALHQAKGRDAVLAVFETFGVDHGSKLKPEQWGEALGALNAAKA